MPSLPTPKKGGGFPEPGSSDELILSFSRGVSVVLLIVYLFYLLFSLKTQKCLKDQSADAILNERSQNSTLDVVTGPKAEEDGHLKYDCWFGRIVIDNHLGIVLC